MKQQLHADPLSPAGRRADLELSTFKHGEYRRPGPAPRSGKCFVCVLAGFVVLSVAVLVFAVTVLRIKSPDVKLTSVTVKNLRYGNLPSPSFNGTLVAEMSIKNTNFGYFEFESGVVDVQYDGVSVGKRKIGRGIANGKETKKMNVTVDVTASKVSEMDRNSGILELRSYAKLRGRVCSLKIIKKMKTAEMNCTITINLNSATINDLICQ